MSFETDLKKITNDYNSRDKIKIRQNQLEEMAKNAAKNFKTICTNAAHQGKNSAESEYGQVPISEEKQNEARKKIDEGLDHSYLRSNLILNSETGIFLSLLREALLNEGISAAQIRFDYKTKTYTTTYSTDSLLFGRRIKHKEVTERLYGTFFISLSW